MDQQKSKNKTKYKALMLDVDGTLVPNRQDGIPSARVKKTIEKARDKIHIGVVTARPIFHMYKIFHHLQLSGPAIVNAGTKIIDADSKKVIWEKPLNSKDSLEVLAIARKFSDDIYINDGDYDYFHTATYIYDKKFGIYLPELTLEKVADLEQELSHIPTVFVHKMISWKDGKIDAFITHAEATKQHGILEVAKILDINTHEIIGVGDAYNDFPLLMACGFKVAMGNAVEELKAIADYIAPTVEEDGVADVIEKFVLKGDSLM